MSQATEAPKSGWAEAVETVKTVVIALLIALVLRVFIFQPYTIPSASMEPNLYEGDYIVVSKWSYGYSRYSAPLGLPLFHGRVLGNGPKRGDIVVFRHPVHHEDLIKRVMGLPGDRLQMRAGLLYVNGQQVPRSLTGVVTEDSGYGFLRQTARFRETPPGGPSYMTNDFGLDGPLDNTDTYVVPQGHYFMMGDNRDNSTDSRVPPEDDGVGFVPAENIVGRARLVLWSWNKGASLMKPWTWLNLNTRRFFKPLH
jgi:signal peptidase I